MQRGKRRNSELASLTVSILLISLYWIAVCWVIPVIPVMISWMLEWSFRTFLTLWFTGLPPSCIALYYCLKIRGD